MTGSFDLYKEGGRPAGQSINFVTCHDGFTLDDLVSFDHKHNEANRELNTDGVEFQSELELVAQRARKPIPESSFYEPGRSGISLHSPYSPWERRCC